MTDAAVGAITFVTLLTIMVGARGIRVARTPDDFMVAARQVPPALNAAAISGEYLSAASFLGIAGLVVAQGLGALWYSVGYTAGYLVLLLLVGRHCGVSARTRSPISPSAGWGPAACARRRPHSCWLSAGSTCCRR